METIPRLMPNDVDHVLRGRRRRDREQCAGDLGFHLAAIIIARRRHTAVCLNDVNNGMHAGTRQQ